MRRTSPLAALLEVAAPQHGLFTLAQAAEVGVGDAQVRKMAARGDLEHRAHGLYRIAAVPINERTELMEAALWAKGRGVITCETALGLWDLADVNPRLIDVCVPPTYRPRKRGGEAYKIHVEALAPGDIDEVDGVPVVVPAIAIRNAIAHGVGGDLVEQAIRQGQAREHFGARTAARLLVELDDRGRATARR